MTGEPTRRLIRVIAWLLTPVMAWAASFLGAWIGAVIGKGAEQAAGGLIWLGTGGIIGGAVGVVSWVVLLRRFGRSPVRSIGGGKDHPSSPPSTEPPGARGAAE